MIKEVAFPRHLNFPDLEIPTKNRFDNLIQRRMHIANCLVDDPSSTYYFEVDNDQMQYFGIKKGSIVVVARTANIESGMLIFCCVNDEWLIRKLCKKGESTFLCINNKMDACLNVTGREINIFGVVKWTCSPSNS